MIKYIITFLILFSVANAKTPIGFKHWRLDEINDTTFAMQFGGAVRNYENGNGWDSIANNFEVEGDSILFVDKSVLKVRVNKNGVSTVMLIWNDIDYTVEQKLLGIGWIKISTRQSLWIDSTMDWSNVSMDSNIVKWTNVSPAVDYRVLKRNGQVAHGIFYKKPFLDSAVVLYNQRSDSLDIALANVMIYTLSANIDDYDSAMGELSLRRLKSFGEYKFSLGKQRLRFPGSDTLSAIPVKQYWERRGNKIICIEYVMMKWVKQVHEAYPNAVIWHNDVKTIEGATNVDDAYIRDGASSGFNYGSAQLLHIDGDLTTRSLIRVKNVASEIGGGATVTAAVCSLNCYTNGGTETISAYRGLKPWVEGTQNGINCTGSGVTWDDWDCDDLEWTTPGVECARDDGVDNSDDGGPCNNSVSADRKATAEDSESIDGTGWFAWNMSSGLASGWYDGSFNEEGVILITGGTNFNLFRSTEWGGSSVRPFWVFTYTIAEPSEISGRRRKIMLLNNQ